MPLRRGQNVVALAATLLASGALLPLEPRVRFVLIGVAAAVILMLLVVRLRGHAVRRDAARVSGVYERIERIREQRSRTKR